MMPTNLQPEQECVGSEWLSEWPNVDGRILELMKAIGMPFEELPLPRMRGRILDIPEIYTFGSQPDNQVWDGDKLVFDPKSTDGYDLLHEVAHHIECLARFPSLVTKRNWGINPIYDRFEKEDDDLCLHFAGEEELSLMLPENDLLEGEVLRESLACYIEVALHVLWNTGLWMDRANHLNLFESVEKMKLPPHEPPGTNEGWKKLVLDVALPLMDGAGVPERFTHTIEE